jgi:peptide/nickel transport system substrate-binding protein
MKKFFGKAGLIVFAVLLAAVTLGCGGGSKSAEKVRLNVGINADPDTLNPAVSRDVAGFWLASLQYPTLLKRDSNAALQPFGAEGFTISDDGMEITFNLKKDLKWSDGTPFTSADVLYSKYLMADLRLSNLAGNFDMVQEILTPDDHTVVFKLVKPSYTFVGGIGPWMHILPKHIWEKIDDPGKFLNDKDVVGMGPYLLKEAKRGEYYIYEAAGNWFQAPGGGKPAVDEIVLRVYPDMNAMVLALQSGEIDVTAAAVPFDSAEMLKSAGLQIENNDSLGYIHTSFNTRNEFLADLAVRRALAAAIDKKTILQFAIKNEGSVMDSIVSPVFVGLGSTSPAAKYPSYNPAEAKKYLSDAGYKDTNGNGIVNSPRSGRDVKFNMIYDGSDIVVKNAVEIVYQNYKAIGIDLELLPMEKTTYTGRLRSLDFDSWLGGWGTMEILNGDMNIVYESTSTMYYYGPPEKPFTDIDAALDLIKKAGTYDQIVTGVHAFEEAMAKECIAIPLFVQHFAYPHNVKFQGYKVFPSNLCGIIDPECIVNLVPAGK